MTLRTLTFDCTLLIATKYYIGFFFGFVTETYSRAKLSYNKILSENRDTFHNNMAQKNPWSTCAR